MNSIPLSEALKLATPRPWLNTDHDDEGHYDIQSPSAGALIACGAGFYGESQPSKANAALICHAVNLLPDLVAALEEVLSKFATKEAFPEYKLGDTNDRFIELATVETRARGILTRAQTVPMP